MIVKQAELLTEKGVYQIRNLITERIYVGSTKMSFQKRYFHHVNRLRNNAHKNAYLQHSFNKHGEDNFIFEILEVCSKDKCLEREQHYLDNTIDLYNINPFATGIDSSQKDVIEKRRQTMLRKYKSGELDCMKELARNRIPWNKGKKYESTDHLKVPKEKKGDRLKDRITKRKKLPKIEVYDASGVFLGKWNSSKDLEEWSLTDANNLPIQSRFSVERMGKPVKLLQSVNINKSCKTGNPYKGLIFKFLTSPTAQ